MKTVNISSAALAAVIGLAVISPAMAASAVIAQLPPRGISYYWTPEQQIVGYRSRMMIDPARMVGVGRWTNVHQLPLAVHQISPHWIWNGQPMDVDRYMEATRVSGILVIKDGQILLERYGLGRTENDVWESQSTGKSITALLVGAAIQDGYIKSVDSLVTDYILELKGSAYQGVTIRQLLTMTSGVAWDEDTAFEPNGLGSRLWKEPFVNGVDPIVAFMRRVPRANKPGAKFAYSSADADLAGILVIKATGRSLAEYMSEKIWQPYGMEKPAYWITDPAGNERGGCGCFESTLRDFARIGQFVLEGGKAGGVQTLPPDWLAQATSPQVNFPTGAGGSSGEGYGYFWWTYKDHFAAQGHAGQAIYVYPKDNVVIALNSAWLEDNQPNRPDYDLMKEAFMQALHTAAVDHR